MSVVVDIGTDTTKAGFSGSNVPDVILPSVVGIPKSSRSGTKKSYVGPDVQSTIKSEKLNVVCPVDDGIITDWDAMEEIWRHIFEVELKVSLDQYDVLLTEPPLNPEQNREMTTQIMFETFNAEGFYLGSTAVMSLYSVRCLSGLVLSSGEGVTHCVPVYDGSTLPQGIMKFDIAGKDLTDYLGNILEEQGRTFSSAAEKYQISREIKEKFCYVADDFAEEMASPVGEESYKLPDKTVFSVGKERFKSPEALFQPYLAGKETVGIHKFVYQSIMKCDYEMQDQLFENILLSGGSTMFPYFPARLQREVTLLAPADVQVQVVAKHDRENAAWIGGSVLAEMSTFANMIIRRNEYDEFGPSIVRRKCD